ncbi:MAG: hypothetical protein FJX62_22070 [Alphaproteobacteria bacterium]|nr:hypothetical protein [Alphaproteobacteria bacterium]
MAMQGDMQRPSVFRLWWWRRLARHRDIERAAAELLDGYGPAAYGIARNSARANASERRYWRAVARRIRWRLFAAALPR